MRAWVAATILILLAPGAVAAEEPDYAARVEALRARLPDEGKGFTIVVQRPFVVIGDEQPAVVRRRATQTVKWAVDLLKKDFFPKDPDRILDIYLFKDARSYRHHADLLFGDTPTSPYGYYCSAHDALVMNIATGGGTLVHEIVHPFVEANFPECPSWLNEGLGSLFERCGEREGHIVGYPNWRLPILQHAIRAGTMPTFETLCSTTRREFYGDGRGVHYAQARYLCYHLQEEGLLRDYYKAFFAAREEDPTGYRTLVKILGEEDMGAFERRWKVIVQRLRLED